jgi:hypothetical protein
MVRRFRKDHGVSGIQHNIQARLPLSLLKTRSIFQEGQVKAVIEFDQKSGFSGGQLTTVWSRYGPVCLS